METRPRWSIGVAAALILAHTAAASAQSWKLLQAAGGSTVVSVTPPIVSIEGPAGRMEIPVARIVDVGYSRRLLTPEQVVEQWDSRAHSVLNTP